MILSGGIAKHFANISLNQSNDYSPNYWTLIHIYFSFPQKEMNIDHLTII
jgi:hypothetical protein